MKQAIRDNHIGFCHAAVWNLRIIVLRLLELRFGQFSQVTLMSWDTSITVYTLVGYKRSVRDRLEDLITSGQLGNPAAFQDFLKQPGLNHRANAARQLWSKKND